LLNNGSVGLIGGAHDALSARLVEEAQFDGIRKMVDAVERPVLADCNAGFGNAINVIYMTREYEKAGVAGICIEDNCFPKRCSLYDRKQRELVPIGEMVRKIEAAKSAQQDPDFVVIGRVEALIAGHGKQAALDRAGAYAEAGADALVVHSRSFALLQEFLASWEGKCPLVVIPTLFDHVSLDEIRSCGFKLVIFPNQAVRAAVQAMQATLATLRETGLGSSVSGNIAPLTEVYRLIDLEGFESAEKRFLTPPDGGRRAEDFHNGGGSHG
jgi:phosphoenolpyruvate phosphomutase